MRRGKPQQQYYRPGSGPLRKSGHDEEPDPNYSDRQSQQKFSVSSRLRVLPRDCDFQETTDRLGDMKLEDSDSRRKMKKPEQQIYVPRALLIARENNDKYIPSEKPNHNTNGNQSHASEKPSGRSKRYSNRRRPSDAHDNRDDLRSHSPGRNFRQGSEPRNINNQNWNSRQRDTRSVEPSIPVTGGRNINEKIMQKPPSGRRHSTVGLEMERRSKNFENLPPRLKRKALEESKMTLSCPAEESWDGGSLTFEGSHGYGSRNPNLPHGHPANQHVQSNDRIYYTLPNSRPRGRGRFAQDSYETTNRQDYRCATPDRMYSPCNSRPQSPHLSYRARSNDNLHRPPSRSQTPVNVMARIDDTERNYHKRVDYGGKVVNDVYNGGGPQFREPPPPRKNQNQSETERYRSSSQNNQFNNNPLPPPSSTNTNTSISAAATTKVNKSPPKEPVSDNRETKVLSLNPDDGDFDWNKEIECLEQETFSDSLTRSSSVVSLMENSTASLPASANKKTKRRKSKKKSRKRGGSRGRERSVESQSREVPRRMEGDGYNRTRHNSTASVESSSKDGFKHPEGHPRRRRRSRNWRDHSFDRNSSRHNSRERSFERHRKMSASDHENWRDENTRSTVERELPRSRNNSEREPPPASNRSRNNSEKEFPRSRNNSEREPKKEGLPKKGGLLVLPQTTQLERKKPPELHSRFRNQEMERKVVGQKTLYDPNNPNTPILVNASNSRVSVPTPGYTENPEPQFYTDQFGNLRPAWYNVQSESFKSSRCQNLLNDIKQADYKLQFIINDGLLFDNWDHVCELRSFLSVGLEYLLSNDLIFCQKENIEQHLWKILYYNIIETTRKAIANNPANKEHCKTFILNLIDEGTKYFERLLECLENTYNFKLNSFLGNNCSPQSGLGHVGLALVSAQKIFLFLGDLARYREQINDTSNYGKCRSWYVKANEINPKNGKPYYQLANLAVLARRKLDAVYYYMRSLMSSNPVHSARESLTALFDEIRKKYDHGQRKRKEERLERERQNMKEKESQVNSQGSLRKETWIRPDGGKRMHRTTSTVPESKNLDSEEENLASLTSMEMNKRFVTSFLHVQGKLITKIGMETFHETSLQMLKEFRTLLQYTPLSVPCNRFLQILALNMFAIESTQLKDPQLQSQPGYRSEQQESALVVSLQMFNLILERTVALLQEYLYKNEPDLKNLPLDIHTFLPVIKIWCDWMICHSNIWNPPPSTQDFKVGQAGDAWGRMAMLVNLLDKLDQSLSQKFVSEPTPGYEQIRLPEDTLLIGFNPFMHFDPEPTYAPAEADPEELQLALRLHKILFFGKFILCGLEPPVLKLQLNNGISEYFSVVRTSASRSSPPSPPELNDDDDLLVESFSEGEEEPSTTPNAVLDNTSSEMRELLMKKVELSKRLRNQELHRQRVQKILQQSVVSVHIEVRPKYLIPDTNCFIDYLETLKSVASAHVYVLMVPLVVLSELEGLSKGGKPNAPLSKHTLSDDHVKKVAESAKKALEFLGTKHPSIKCITTKGTVLTSSTFTAEDDSATDALKNDDKILATCLTLCKTNQDKHIEGQPRELFREVVLLTEDRNLRVKALARDVPVRELPDFVMWAGLG